MSSVCSVESSEGWGLAWILLLLLLHFFFPIEKKNAIGYKEMKTH